MKKTKYSFNGRKEDIFAVVLAGGSGTRLWPMSRQLLPKQFINIDETGSLLEATIKRVRPLASGGNVIIVANKLHAFGSGYNQMKGFRVIIEPEGRNTAPAIGLAAAYARKLGEDPVLVVLPSDHAIKKTSAFLSVLKTAVFEAEKGRIVTLGIVPDRAETGYGYLEVDKPPREFNKSAVKVRRFVEKPDIKTAEEYLKSGRYFWNSGMFIFKASVMLDEIKKHLPKAHKSLLEISKKAFDGETIDYSVLNRIFSEMPDISIDYGVMEKSPIVSMIPSEIGWSDVGSWYYLHKISRKDKKGNFIRGNVMAQDCENSLLYGADRLVAAIGVKDLAVAETADAVLVCPLHRSQEVKNIVAALKEKKMPQYSEHLTVERPWGSYTVLEDSPSYKVKRLKINPGQKISYQLHRRRSEHWIVVSGTAEVQKGDERVILNENQSIDIPREVKHKLSNHGDKPLQIIEVQSGDYLGEDDIERFEDVYGRTKG